MKNSDVVAAGTPLALPPVSYAHRIAIVTKPSPADFPYVEYLYLEIDKKTGEVITLMKGVATKEKVQELAPRISQTVSAEGVLA